MMADESSRRVSFFALGSTLAACGGVAVWGAFALLTMMMDPTLVGAGYWQGVRGRAANNPLLVAVIACGGIGVLGGVALMVRSLVRRSHSTGGPP